MAKSETELQKLADEIGNLSTQELYKVGEAVFSNAVLQTNRNKRKVASIIIKPIFNRSAELGIERPTPAE